MARASGGGLFAPWLKNKLGSFGGRLPEIMFSMPFGYCLYMSSGLWHVGVLGAIFSFLAMETGHGTVYGMNGYHSSQEGRIQTIEKIIRPIYLKFGGDIYSPLYSWICMGFKGLLIGLAAFPFGLLLAILWPFSYWVGKVEGNTEISEWVSGMMAGLVIYLTLTVF
jgi:hypothetical protein